MVDFKDIDTTDVKKTVLLMVEKHFKILDFSLNEICERKITKSVTKGPKNK